MRFQEYYENPHFKDKVFTTEEFKQWYTEKYGRFSYNRDWVGFNLPDTAFSPFLQGRFDPLDEKEQFLLKCVKEFFTEPPFYIIGTYGKEKPKYSTLKHEICHAMFYLDEEYKENSTRVLSRQQHHRMMEKLKRRIIRAGYHESVAMDESQAYLLTDKLFILTAGVNPFFLGSLTDELERLFDMAKKRQDVVSHL